MRDGDPRKLTPDVWRLLIAFSGANAATAVANIFVNLFIFVVSGQLSGLIWFNGAYFFSLTFVFYGVAVIFRGRPPMVPYRIGLLLTVAFYILVLVVNRQASHWVTLFGIFLGIAQGIYWFGVNLMTFDGVPAESRIPFYGYSGAINSLNGVVGPTLGGALIALVPGMRGYLLVFAFALALYVGALLASLKVPLGPPMVIGPLSEPQRIAKSRKDWRLTLKTIVVRGTREGITGLAGVFLVYLATQKAWAVGIYGGVTALSRILASLVVSRRVTRERRAQSIWVGVTGMTAAALILALGRSWPMVFGYGILAALSLPFYTVPNASIPLDVMDRDPEVGRHRVGFMLGREVALNMGRIASLAALAIGSRYFPGPTVLVALLVLTALIQGWIGIAVVRLFGPRPA